MRHNVRICVITDQVDFEIEFCKWYGRKKYRGSKRRRRLLFDAGVKLKAETTNVKSFV